MKILFFIEGLGTGGKERRLVELIKALDKDENFEMHLVLIKDRIHFKDVLSTKIKIHYILRNKLKKDPKVFFKFYSLVRNVKPDVIHVWSNISAIYAVPTRILTRIPLINNQITDAPTTVNSSFLNHKLSFPFSDKIVANTYAGLKAYDAPKSKSLVIYNGFDFSRIHNLVEEDVIRKKFKIKTKYVVGMVASFSDKKDYDTFIKAANIVLDNVNNITFLCVGAGDISRVQKMVHSKNSDRVLFLGRQENVESIMNICHIGVLCTFTEGISNSLLEFMSLEKPILVTGSGGCEELMEHEKNGFLFQQGEFNLIADKIIKFITNELDMNSFGKKSKEIVLNRFSINQMITDYKNLYLNNIK